jgi:Transglutaminase-like superfamily
MNNDYRCALVSLAVLLNFTTNTYAQRLAPDIKTSNPRVYDVTMTTTFVVPENGRKLGHLRVWHALPTSRPWDGLDRTLGASEITYEPESGHVGHLANNESQHVLWQFHEIIPPGRKFTFVSRFRIISNDRTYDYKKSIAKWSDYYYPHHEIPRQFTGDLAVVLEDIKKNHPPGEAALEICKWITSHIKYDASVSYPPNDVAATLKNRKGHCGHQVEMFAAMCSKVGIPSRPISGLNLQVPEGIGPLHKTRPDFENQHTWAQIYLPGSGWVEIDPAAGPEAYSIPSQLVQNNADFQNYVIWIEEDETWKQPDWNFRDGKWFSPYGVESRRTFRHVETK